MAELRRDEALQRLGEIDDTVAAHEEQFEVIRGGYDRVVKSNSAMEKRIDDIDGRFQSVEGRIMSIEDTMKAILKNLEKRPMNSPIRDSFQHHIDSDTQVHPSSSEQHRRDRDLGYRQLDQGVDHRKGLFKKVEMPVFGGENPYGWITRAERYFRVTRYDPAARLELVSLSLEDDALSWFNYEVEHRPFYDWHEFKRRMLARFADSFEKTPGKRFFGIQQTGTIAEYVREFQELASQVHVEEEHKIDVFFNGLKKEMKEVIKMKEPKTLPDHIEAVIKMEDSEFCRLLAASKPQENKVVKQGVNTQFRTVQTSINQPWKNKQTTTEVGSKPGLQKQQDKPLGPLKLSDEEYEWKKKNGICFKCPEKWSRAHLCKNKQLQVMIVYQGLELELKDEEFQDASDQLQETTTEVIELSLHSFMGWSSPTTTKLEGRIGKTKVIVLIDSGATHNFISPTAVEKARLVSTNQEGLTIMVGTGIKVSGTGICKGVELQIQEVRITSDFVVLEPGCADIVLGVQWLRTLGKCEVDWEEQELSFLTDKGRVTLKGDPRLHQYSVQKSLSQEGLWMEQNPTFYITEMDTTSTVVHPLISSLLEEFNGVFHEPTELPPKRGFEHAIRLIEGTGPISVRPYRYPHAHMTAIEKMVGEMLSSGIIRQSRSPFASPVLLVKKKTGEWRFCIDYRAVNKATVPDKFPIPVIDQLLDELDGATIYSKLDLRSGYHQIRMVDEDIEKTAFRTHEGHYEFMVMPFGLTNAPATFQALMNDVFKPFLRKFVLVFFDDILVYSKSVEEHEIHLREVLSLLRKHSLFANKKKCLFGQSHVDYLGHIISAEGVATDPEKTKAMSTWPTPRNVKELRGFLGLTGYYRRFVHLYGGIARPLTDLLKFESFIWTQLQQAAFEALKKAMVSAPVLSLPNFHETFIIEADASGFGLGAVLMQKKNPIAYFSKGLSDKEQLKPIYERELMAVVLAVQKWKHYLMGKKFIVHTDQRSLKFLLEQRDVSMDYQKWLTKLLGYDFEIVYKKGSENKAADGLSRIVRESGVSRDMLLGAITVTSSLQMQEIFEEVDSDKELKKRVHAVTVGSEQKQGYSVIGGRLFYKNRLVLSRSSRFIPMILSEYHDGVMGGHSGVLKTIKRIQHLFHWSKLKDDVRKFVSECTVCQTHKYSTLSPAGLLQPIPLPTQIWSEISMDFIEGLPKSEGMDIILVVVDRFSKYSHFVSLKHPYTASTVAAVFVREIVRLHGYPTSIISDRDRVFLSKFWRECFRLAGTKLKFSTAYHPQSDGQTEVLNRCLESYLRCFTSDHPKQWHRFLSWAEYWYNTSYHTSIQTSPFKLVYGRDPPELLWFEHGSTNNFELEQMLKTRDRLLLDAKDNLIRAQAAMKNNADKHRRELEIAVGSQVFLKLRPYRQTSVAKRFCQKLAAKYYGPFLVLERIGSVAYRLQLPPESKIHPVFHVSQLKPVLGQGHSVSTLPVLSEESEGFILQPEHLVSSRYDEEGHLEVLVHWKGLPDHERSWLRVKDIKKEFPEFELEDKLNVTEGGNDKPWRRYVRRRLRNKREEVEVLENEIEAGDDVDLAVTNDG